MFKKGFTMFFCLLFFLFALVYFVTPELNELSSKITFYTSYSNSNAIKTNTDNKLFLIFKGVTGESCTLTKSQVSLQQVEKEYCLKEEFIEEMPNFTIRYYSSNKLKYKKKVNGKQISMQVVEYEKEMIIGTPIIYGSF